MLVLSADQILSLIQPAEIISSVRDGFIQYSSGAYDVPDRMHIGDEQFTYLLMPAIGSKYYCTKLVSVLPSNKKVGMPIVSGSVILNKMESGETLAIMDAGMITALRTAAVGALGMSIITNEDHKILGVIGCGVQGVWQTILAETTRPFERVYCYSRSPDKFESYKNRVSEACPELEIIWCASADEVVRNSEVIYACTTSNKPVFSNDSKLIKNKKFISIGSFRKDMQELPDSVYEHSKYLIIDTNTAKREVGDVINAVIKGYFENDQIIELGQLLNGAVKLKMEECNVYKSVGMAAFDLALAATLYERAIKLGSGTHVNL